jgi:hypothetical protein
MTGFLAITLIGAGFLAGSLIGLVILAVRSWSS